MEGDVGLERADGIRVGHGENQERAAEEERRGKGVRRRLGSRAVRDPRESLARAVPRRLGSGAWRIHGAVGMVRDRTDKFRS